MRKTISWNSQWEFYKGEDRTTAAWEQVDLPHTWNASDGQDGGGDYYQGPAWYRKTLDLESEGEEIYIRFGAVSKAAEVFCNGQTVGTHRGGFSAFTFELTSFLRAGANEILVRADNSNSLPVYPRQADFTFFGGIYREVELICFTRKVHLDVTSAGTDAVFVTPEASGRVVIDSAVTGFCTVQAKIYDACGRCAASSERQQAIAGKVRLELQVAQAHRWHGTEDPYLYRAELTLYDAGNPERELDAVSAAFGFRTFSVSPAEGFFLNGISYPLRGVCRHQDREDMGWAITEKEHREDMALIREIGANTIRLAHYQQAPYFYDLSDQNGMVVWAEIPFISAYDDRREADDNLRQQMRELILQNYNHPSICFWGVANELGIGGESEQAYEMVRELNRIAKSLDSRRLTAIANVGMTRTDSPLFHITDVASYNEYMGWYEKTADDHGPFCDERHGEIPQIPLAVSEYGAESVLSWHSAEPKVKDYTEEYQALVHEKAERAFASRPYLYAAWLWNMFDFAADARDEGGSKGRNNKGLVTYDRRIRKQAFYYYKARWSREPFIYICGKRFTKRAEGRIIVKVYTNQPQVELWVNGAPAGSLEGDAVFEFRDIALERQFNEIVAKTPDGLADCLILEKVDQMPEEYVCKEEKQLSPAVTQWFANLIPQEKAAQIERVIVVKEGYLSVNDPMEEIYRYPEGFAAVQELVVQPMASVNPNMAARMAVGGGMSFASIWNHIHKQLPDEIYYLLNERLIRIKKKEN